MQLGYSYLRNWITRAIGMIFLLLLSSTPAQFMFEALSSSIDKVDNILSGLLIRHKVRHWSMAHNIW